MTTWALRVRDGPTATHLTYAGDRRPVLAVEVPFGKWAHLLNRPLATVQWEVDAH